MTSSEIAIREQHDTDSWVAMLPAVGELAREVYQTEFVPGALRGKPPAVVAAILAGRELNLPPMQSLQHIHVIDGRPTLSAQMQRSLALAAGHHINIIETNTTRCVVEGRRSARDEWTRVTWTLDDAKKAGLLGRQNWQKHPRRMLQARATAELCQLIFSDAVAGMAATEEVIDDAEGPAAEVVREAAPNGEAPMAAATAAPRTAKRRTATGKAREKPREQPQPAAEGPPLPGEDEPSDDHDQPGTATRGKGGQLTAIWTVLRQVFDFGEEEKDQARAVCEHIIGRDLQGTTGNMSHNEARTVLDTLANWQQVAESNSETPRAFLIALMSGQEAQDSGPEHGGQDG
jgi:hypothetical protein